jgi:hypothetical protein
MLVAVIGFYGLLFKSVQYVGRRVGPRLHQIENTGPQ